MQLDKTEIVIRQRSALELLDLSLIVLRRHLGPIMATSALFGLPLMLCNILLVQWMLGEDAYLAAEMMGSPEAWLQWRHTMHILALWALQFQIVSMPTTVFLGNQIFFQKVSLRELLQRLRPLWWRYFWTLGVVRLGLAGLVLELCINRSSSFDWYVEMPLLYFVTFFAFLQRACWPFAPEILALERCPLRSKVKTEITYAKRSRSLHGELMSDHIARFITASAFGSLLLAMILGVFLFGKGVATGIWQWDSWMDMLFLPLSLWCIGLFMAAFRFLAYLDSRIRLEGWEIELRLKAEANRILQHEAAVSTGSLNEENTETQAEAVPS